MVGRPLALIGWLLCIAVIAAVVGGFLIVGSPQAARSRKADEQRVSDLVSLVNSVRTYHSEHKKLPEKLSDCKSYSYENAMPTDPGTGKPYDYRQIDKDHFEVGAVFETDTTKDKARMYSGYDLDIDKHPKGPAHFTFPAESATK